MKKIRFCLFFSLCTIFAVCFAFSAGAAEILYSGTCGADGDNLAWTLDDSGLLTVEGSGEMKTYPNAADTPWGAYRKRITRVVIGDGVTSVGRNAFNACDNLTSVIIGDGVKTIDLSAFAGNRRIASVTIGKSVELIGSDAFSICESLKSITIPDSVIAIGNGAFSNCLSLESVTLGKNVTTIGDNAFYSCRSLKSVTFSGKSITSIGDGAFDASFEIERVNITSLEVWMDIEFVCSYSNPLQYGADLYINGELFTEFTMPSGRTVVKDYTFYGCGSLEKITFPEKFAIISDYAFKECGNATIYGYDGSAAEAAATISRLPFVGLNATWKPDVLESGTCGENISYKLYQDGRLVLTFTNDAVTGVIEDGSMGKGIAWGTYAKIVRTVDFPKGITEIGRYAFYNFVNLKAINYNGSEESLNEIEIRLGNEPFEEALVVFTEKVNVDYKYKDARNATAVVNGISTPVIINLKEGTTWKELKANLTYPAKTKVAVYNHKGKSIKTTDTLSTGFVLHHIGEDGTVIEEILISVSGDVNGDGIVNAEDLQNVVAHLAGENNNLNKIAIDKNLDDILTMQELNSFISTFR